MGREWEERAGTSGEGVGREGAGRYTGYAREEMYRACVCMHVCACRVCARMRARVCLCARSASYLLHVREFGIR